MKEKRKHKIVIGSEILLLCMIMGVLGTNAASANPPSNGVSYNKNGQVTVQNALDDLYNKANYGNASAGDILSGKTALVGGKKVTGTMPNLTSNSNIQYTNDNATKVIETDMAWVVNNSDGVNRVVLRYAGENGFITNNTLFGMEQSKIAARIGVTSDKLIDGTSILGVNGTIPNKSNNTGTPGLSWPTANYEVVGTQLRIGIDRGYYGDTNYSNWGTPGIAIENIASKIGLTADKIVKGQTVAGVTGTGTTGYSSCSSCCGSCPSCPSGDLYKYLWFNKTGSLGKYGPLKNSNPRELTFSIDLGGSYSNVQLAYAIVSLENSSAYFYGDANDNQITSFFDRNWTNEMKDSLNNRLNLSSTSVSVSGSTLTVKAARSGGISFGKYGSTFGQDEEIIYRIKGAIYYKVQ